MSAPLVSVIVPAYNASRFLSATLASIVSQSEKRWEAVVVDDGSTDDTAVIGERFVESDSRFTLIRKDNGGASAARNAGFRASDSRSAYVTFMDSDDVWLPHALETLLTCAESHPAAIGSHGLAEFINAHGELVDEGVYSARGRSRLGTEGRRLVPWPIERPTTFDVLINGNVLFPPGLLLVRRTVYQAVGPFDERFNGPEDWDMLIRLSRHGPIEFVDEVILHYRRHDANLGASIQVPAQAWLVRCKGFHSSENSPAQRLAARRGWRGYQGMMAREALEVACNEFRAGHMMALRRHAARLVVFAGRWARGYPVPVVRSGPVAW